MQEYIYDAFISYSHRDMQEAKWLQRRLETFHIPEDMGSIVADAAGETNPRRRRFRIFRDQTDLAGAELENSLERELTASRWLIIVCSPSSAKSSWVNDEIEYFRSLGRGDHIVPFIVSGEPESDDPELECFPPALRGGKTHVLGSNVQEIGRNNALLKLASLLLDVRFNRLADREKKRRRRSIATTCAITALVLVVTGALIWRNVVVARRNQVLSYDIYGAALVSISEKDVIEPADVAFLETSAKAGNSYAMMLLADCYKNGWGTDKDEAAALHWFEKAAEKGDATAMIGVANCYFNGTGTEKDMTKYFEWMMKAAEAGNNEGMANVAVCYEDGIGTEADADKAFEWYKKAAAAGSETGMYNLARCWRDGIGTEPDITQSFEYMEKLAKTGNAFGMYNLGLFYQYGYGTEKDPEQAYYWYRRAAEAGDADGMYMTGWCTENNFGTTDAALEWYRRAAFNGSEEAAEAVKRLTEN